MTDLVRFETTDGAVLVEVEGNQYGLERVARTEAGVATAAVALEDALESIGPTIGRVVEALRSLGPDAAEVEFGIRLNAEAGVVVARTGVEGHFHIRLSWDRTASSDMQ